MAIQLLPFAQQTLPDHDAMFWIMLVSRVLHILGAIILVGGIFYLRAVVVPAASAAGTKSVDQQFGGRRAAWAMWVGIATLLLLVTGLWNYMQTMKLYDRMATSYHMIAGLKMLAALVLFALAALLAGRSAAADQLRQKLFFWLRVALALGVLIVVLGALLRAYPHIPKNFAPSMPPLEAPANAPPAN